MIVIAIGIFVLLAILLFVYADLRAGIRQEDKQVEKQPKTVKIGDCVVDLESDICMTHNCKVSVSEPCDEYLKPYLLDASLGIGFASDEWHSKYLKALRLTELGKKEYRKRYTIPSLGGKVGIATLVCWGITIILGLGYYIAGLRPGVLIGTFGLSACILTIIVLFKAAL